MSFRQADITYGVSYHNVSFLPRRDTFVIQVTGENDYYGYGIDTANPDRPGSGTWREYDRVAVSPGTCPATACT